MPISAPDAIAPALDHAREQLLHPYRLAQWARLAFVGLLAGEMGSFGGCNANVPASSHQPASQHPLGGSLPTLLTNHPGYFAAFVAGIFLVGLGLLLVFSYVSSVMRFLLFDSVVTRECHIRQGWARRRQAALRLFVWRVLFSLSSLAVIFMVIAIPVALAWSLGWFANPRQHLLQLGLGALALLFVFLVLVAVVAVVQVMTKDFVVPQMALEDIGVLEAWRRLWLWTKHDKAGYAGYIGMKLVLAIAAAIIFGIITLIAFLVLMIPIGGLGAAAMFGAKAAGWTWNFGTITLAALLACVALAVIVFVAALVNVPATVFFPAYAIYFFAARYAPLASLLWPRPPLAPGAPG